MMMATVWLKHVAAIYNCYREVVFWSATFLLLMCIVEAQQGYHMLKYHELLMQCLKFWKIGEHEVFCSGIKE